MGRITILKESKPTRCDICHKSDEFNPSTNYCSRCNNIVHTLVKEDYSNIANTSNFLMPTRINQEIVIPDSINIEDLGYSFTIIYNWYSAKQFGFLLIMGASVFINSMRAIFSRNESVFLPILFLALLLSYLLMLISILANKTSITISNNKIVKKSGPIYFLPTQTIDLTDLDKIVHEKSNRRQALYLLLKSGKRFSLIKSGFEDDREKILFVKRVISERLSKS